jgi:hypothetical protein
MIPLGKLAGIVFLFIKIYFAPISVVAATPALPHSKA